MAEGIVFEMIRILTRAFTARAKRPNPGRLNPKTNNPPKRMKLKFLQLNHSLLPAFIALVAATISSSTAFSQIGTGWTSASYTKIIHLDDENGLQTFPYTTDKSVGSGSPCAR